MFRNGDTSKFWAGAFQVAIAFGAFDFSWWLLKWAGVGFGVVKSPTLLAKVEEVKRQLLDAFAKGDMATIQKIQADPANADALAYLNSLGAQNVGLAPAVVSQPSIFQGLPAGYFPQPAPAVPAGATFPSGEPLTLNLNDLDLGSLFPQQQGQPVGAGINTGQFQI